MNNQAMETPLVDMLRAVPVDHRTEWVIQRSEDGHPTGHSMCPIGYHSHKAADKIDELNIKLADSEEMLKFRRMECDAMAQRISELEEFEWMYKELQS